VTSPQFDPAQAKGVLVVVVEQLNPTRPERQKQGPNQKESVKVELDLEGDKISGGGSVEKEVFKEQWGLGYNQDAVIQALHNAGITTRTVVDTGCTEPQLYTAVREGDIEVLARAARQTNARVVIYGVAQPRFVGTQSDYGKDLHRWKGSVSLHAFFTETPQMRVLSKPRYELAKPEASNGDDGGFKALQILAKKYTPVFVREFLKKHPKLKPHVPNTDSNS